jgi:DNA-binding MarR family transcriptional regulator/GNAT superfamily N-acetyltransferase
MVVAAPDQYVAPIRDASRRLVRELGFMRGNLAGTNMPPSAVHALVELGARGSLTAAELSDILVLEKSSVSRMVRKLIVSGELIEKLSDHDGRAKLLSLSEKGRMTLDAINAFAHGQVLAAVTRLSPEARRSVRDGLAFYAGALETSRTKRQAREPVQVVIESGYRPGIIGQAIEMQARYYAHTAGFGRFFEGKIAAELAEFASRMDNTCNGLWIASHSGTVVGTIAIDGEDLGPDTAHLRWFIVDEGLRGGGVGRLLLKKAIEFCDRLGFSAIQLWTFQGLDAAQKLYKQHGFSLAEERPYEEWGQQVIRQRFVRKFARQDVVQPTALEDSENG